MSSVSKAYLEPIWPSAKNETFSAKLQSLLAEFREVFCLVEHVLLFKGGGRGNLSLAMIFEAHH